MTPRRPCRGCRTPIDTDHLTCPFCDTPDPLRHVRRKRRALRIVLFVVLATGLTAMFAL